MSRDSNVILYTILEYYQDRTKEFNKLVREYKVCQCMETRRKMRKRREDLLEILKQDFTVAKGSLTSTLGIKYKDISSDLLEIEMKRRELKREIACLIPK